MSTPFFDRDFALLPRQDLIGWNLIKFAVSVGLLAEPLLPRDSLRGSRCRREMFLLIPHAGLLFYLLLDVPSSRLKGSAICRILCFPRQGAHVVPAGGTMSLAEANTREVASFFWAGNSRKHVCGGEGEPSVLHGGTRMVPA